VLQVASQTLAQEAPCVSRFATGNGSKDLSQRGNCPSWPDRRLELTLPFAWKTRAVIRCCRGRAQVRSRL